MFNFFRQEEPGHFDFEEENVSIYGLSYWHREIGEPVYDSIIPEDRSKINILLVHGGDPQHIPYHPKHILENGFDYIAAGHNSQRQTADTGACSDGGKFRADG